MNLMNRSPLKIATRPASPLSVDSRGMGPVLISTVILVILTFAAGCSRSSSTGGPRQRFLTFNPTTGLLHSVDVHPRDTVFLDDVRDFGDNMDGFAASEFGTTAIVYDRDVSFLVFISYSNPRDLALITTDIGRVDVDIAELSLSPNGRFALFEDASRQEVQLLELDDLTDLIYSESIELDAPIASRRQSPRNDFALLFPEGAPESLYLLDYDDFARPLLEFSLPNTAPLLSFEFLEDNPSIAIGIESGTGRILSLVFEDSAPSGEIVADVLDLGDPSLQASTCIPFRQEAFLGTGDGMVHRLNLENPFRVFVDEGGSFLTDLAAGGEVTDFLLAISPDGEFLLASAGGEIEIYDISERTEPNLLRSFNLGSPITELGFSTENSGRFKSDPTGFLVLGGSTIHLLDLMDRRFPELSPPTAFPGFVARVQQDDPVGGRITGLDANGSILYLSVTLREEDGPFTTGPFGTNPPIGSGFGEVVFFVD